MKPCTNKNCPKGSWDVNYGESNCQCLTGSYLDICKHYTDEEPLKLPEFGKGYICKETSDKVSVIRIDPKNNIYTFVDNLIGTTRFSPEEFWKAFEEWER